MNTGEFPELVEQPLHAQSSARIAKAVSLVGILSSEREVTARYALMEDGREVIVNLQIDRHTYVFKYDSESEKPHIHAAEGSATAFGARFNTQVQGLIREAVSDNRPSIERLREHPYVPSAA